MRTSICRTPMDTFKNHWKSLRAAGMNICLDTFKKYAKKMGFQQYVITKVPALSPPQIKKRLEWCTKRLNWTPEQWENVVWSDESMFRLGKGAPGMNIIRMPGEALQDRHKGQTLKLGRYSLMMWECFYAGALGPLVIMEGSIDQDKYVSLLANHTIPWLEDQCRLYGHNLIYQEDGAPIHTGTYAKWYKSKNQLTMFDFWPPNSPDLNPIEHIWSYLKLGVNKRTINVTNAVQFKSIVKDKW